MEAGLEYVGLDLLPPRAQEKPKRKRPSVARSKELFEKWVPEFGFERYRYRIRCLPRRYWDKCFAACSWHHDGEWFSVDILPDSKWPNPREHEFVVVHELGHGLVKMGDSGLLEEQACNRIARMLLGGSRMDPTWYEDARDNEYELQHPRFQCLRSPKP